MANRIAVQCYALERELGTAMEARHPQSTQRERVRARRQGILRVHRERVGARRRCIGKGTFEMVNSISIA
jgi:hypothetical protein